MATASVILTLLLVAASGPALLWLGHRANLRYGSRGLVAVKLRFQLQALALALAVWGVVLVASGHRSTLAVVGDLDAPVTGMSWLGVGPADMWGTMLITVGGIVVAVTCLVIWLQVIRGSGVPATTLLRVLPLALAFAILNATAEELIFRVSLIDGMSTALASGAISASGVAVISAVLFGAPHYGGYPNGLVGVVMAGFLGWLACMSVYQTGGLLWAWSLHVVLDVVILSALFAAALSRASESADHRLSSPPASATIYTPANPANPATLHHDGTPR